MRILSVIVRNFKKIILAELNDIGDYIEVTGENEAGKSSFMDAVISALSGKRDGADTPVRQGAKQSEVTVVLGENETAAGNYIIRDVRRKGNRYLEVRKNGDEKALLSPAGVVADLVGTGLVLDPMALMTLHPRKLRDTVLGLVGVDLDQFKLRYDEAFALRASVNRDLKDRRARLGEPVEAPDEEVSLSALSERLIEAKEEARRNDKKRQEVRSLRDASDKLLEHRDMARGAEAELKLKLKKAEKQIGEVTVKFENAHRAAQRAGEDAAKLEDPETDPILREMDQAEGINRKVRAKKAHVEGAMEVAALKSQSANFSRTLEAIEEEKLAALAAADMPVPGLEIDDEGLILGGLPLAAASTSQRIVCCTRILAAMKPHLSVVFVKSGNDLSRKTFQDFIAICKELGLQPWIERIEPVGDENVIRIEEGVVVDG